MSVELWYLDEKHGYLRSDEITEDHKKQGWKKIEDTVMDFKEDNDE